MKKTLLIVLILITVASFSLSAAAIGASFSLNFLEAATSSGISLTGKMTELPPVFGLSLGLSSNQFNLGATADWWMYQRPLVGIISMYAGPGAYLKLGLGDTTMFDIGARVPIGFQIFPFGADPEIELFLEIAPRLGIGLGGDAVRFPEFGIQGAIGGRFWFDNR
ncbi:MAG: hypothetical protein JEY99_08140 [Spirochaetales bacterium]|nr:hypothetical protein [Spirochaetales bacterium]